MSIKSEYYILMENIKLSGNDIIVYDLKGSESNRFLNKDSQVTKGVGLDTNFKIDFNGEPIAILQKDQLLACLEKDTQWLAEQDRIDYSLLVSIDLKNELIKFGIIDYLQTFNFLKKGEFVYKTLTN